MTTDFAQLYSELGIRTDCSLDEFKQACRRRIKQQHPDRAAAAVDAAAIPLAELLPLYAKALRFHRKHGRLPGAVPVPVHAMPAMERPFPAVAPNAAAGTADRDDPPRASMRGPLLLTLAITIVVAVAGAWNDHAPEKAEPAQVPAAEAAQEAEQSAVAPRLEIGMDAETVRKIQGDPLQWEGSQWIYGPSWLYFEDDRLADWYSSPLYPLETATSSPPPVDEQQTE